MRSLGREEPRINLIRVVERGLRAMSKDQTSRSGDGETEATRGCAESPEPVERGRRHRGVRCRMRGPGSTPPSW